MAQHPSIGGDDIGEVVAGLAMWLVISLLAILFAGTLKLFAPLAARAVQAAVSPRPRVPRRCHLRLDHPQPGGSRLRAPEARGRPDPFLDTNRGTQHLWIVNPVKDPSEGGHGWFDTHPATADRIARLRALTARTQAGHGAAPHPPADGARRFAAPPGMTRVMVRSRRA